MSTPRALGRAGVGLSLASVLSLAAIAISGPSAVSAEAGPPGPRRTLGLNPERGLITFLLAVALAAAGVGVWCGWLALRRGWRPRLVPILRAGVGSAVLLALVPPMGSTDIGIYAVYGRMVMLGLNPYTSDVLEMLSRHDPIALAYAGPWLTASSVYGPVATLMQAGAAAIGGTSARIDVIALQVGALMAFLLTAWLLDRTARRQGEAARLRVALMWTFNPLLIYNVVNAGHVDGLATMLGIAGVLAVRRTPVAAGVLGALAVAVKITFVWYGIAVAWVLRRDSRTLLRYLAAAVLTGIVVFAPVFPEILAPLRHASRHVTSLSIWHPVVLVLVRLVPGEVIPQLIQPGSLLLLLFVSWRLDLVVTPAAEGDRGGRAVRAAAVVGTAWLLTAGYVLPWYEVIAWAPLVLVMASELDLVLLIRSVVAAIAYVPGTVHTFGLMVPLRSVVAPAVSWALLLVACFVLPRRSQLSRAGSPAP